jgi:hypothetical protein
LLRTSGNEEPDEKGGRRGGKRKEILGLMFREVTIFSLLPTYVYNVRYPGLVRYLLLRKAGMIGPDFIPQLKGSLFSSFPFLFPFARSFLASIGKNARDNSRELFQLWPDTN